jgi:rhodanese-related sulfurtransferase
MLEKTLKAKELYEEIEANPDSFCIIDVRSDDEYNSGTISGARCIPYNQLKSKIESIPKDKKVVLFCKSGARSAKAHKLFSNFNNVHQLEGGISSWIIDKLPILKRRPSSISIQRQVMILAGSIVAIGTLLAITVDKQFYLIPLLVGLGLCFAGISDFCGLALLLEKMPWNKLD